MKKGQVPIQHKNSKKKHSLLLPLGILVPAKETTDDQSTIRQGANHPEQWQLGGINLEPLPTTMPFPHLQLQPVLPAIFGAAPSKTHLLRCVHKVQAPRIMRELIPFLNMSPTVLLTISHHKW